jgi:hypothetical protein
MNRSNNNNDNSLKDHQQQQQHLNGNDKSPEESQMNNNNNNNIKQPSNDFQYNQFRNQFSTPAAHQNPPPPPQLQATLIPNKTVKFIKFILNWII